MKNAEQAVTGALAGIRILDFTQYMQGPWATELLGDMGADVIKVEPPGHGDWERSYTFGNHWIRGHSPLFLSMNRNKRSIVVNLKTPGGRELIRRMVRKCDVVVENGRPGVMKRLGLDYESLREIKPDLIYCSATGYGSTGPYAHRPGQDLLIQGLSGLLSITGSAGDIPTPSGTPVADAHGSRAIVIGILLALFHRERTGEGQLVETCLLDALVASQTQEFVTYLNDGPWPQRSESGIAHVYTAAPYGVYRTADGYLTLAMTPIPKLADLLDLPDLARYDTLELAYEHRDEIKRRIQERLAQASTAHWLEILGAADVWCGPVHDYDDVQADPQVRHNELFQTIDHPEAGEHVVVRSPIRMSRTPPTIRRPAPLLGEHTEEILAEFGFGEQEIARLYEEGVVEGRRHE